MPEMSHQNNTRRIARANRGTAAKRDARATVEELATARRAQVFRQDAEHAPIQHDVYAALTPELIEQVRQLRAKGIPHLDIGIELNLNHATVGKLCRDRNFPKGEPVVKPRTYGGR